MFADELAGNETNQILNGSIIMHGTNHHSLQRFQRYSSFTELRGCLPSNNALRLHTQTQTT